MCNKHLLYIVFVALVSFLASVCMNVVCLQIAGKHLSCTARAWTVIWEAGGWHGPCIRTRQHSTRSAWQTQLCAFDSLKSRRTPGAAQRSLAGLSGTGPKEKPSSIDILVFLRLSYLSRLKTDTTVHSPTSCRGDDATHIDLRRKDFMLLLTERRQGKYLEPTVKYGGGRFPALNPRHLQHLRINS